MFVEISTAISRSVTALIIFGYVFFLSCPTCDFAKSTSNDDLQQLPQQIQEPGAGEHIAAEADHTPPTIPPYARHIRTRKWRTRVSRRLCSADIDVAESLDADTRAECVALCMDHVPECRAANFLGGDLSICELYHCVPTEFEHNVEDCQYIQVHFRYNYSATHLQMKRIRLIEAC
jgi:hypothetical protein